MSISKTANLKKEKPATRTVDNSMYASQTKISKAGTAWKQKTVWFRKEHLNKLKVIAHFEDTTTDQLIDRAVGEFIAQTFDKSGALHKIVTKATKTVKI